MRARVCGEAQLCSPACPGSGDSEATNGGALLRKRTIPEVVAHIGWSLKRRSLLCFGGGGGVAGAGVERFRQGVPCSVLPDAPLQLDGGHRPQICQTRRRRSSGARNAQAPAMLATSALPESGCECSEIQQIRHRYAHANSRDDSAPCNRLWCTSSLSPGGVPPSHAFSLVARLISSVTDRGKHRSYF